MIPGRTVDSGPGCGITLPTCVAGSRKNEGPFLWIQLQHSFIGGTRVFHAIDVMDLEVRCCSFLEAWLVNPVLRCIGHCLGRICENGRFVHVIPESADMLRCKLLVERAPPCPRFLLRELGKHCSPRPDRANISGAIRVSDKVVPGNRSEEQ